MTVTVTVYVLPIHPPGVPVGVTVYIAVTALAVVLVRLSLIDACALLAAGVVVIPLPNVGAAHA